MRSQGRPVRPLLLGTELEQVGDEPHCEDYQDHQHDSTLNGHVTHSFEACCSARDVCHAIADSSTMVHQDMAMTSQTALRKVMAATAPGPSHTSMCQKWKRLRVLGLRATLTPAESKDPRNREAGGLGLVTGQRSPAHVIRVL